MAFMCSLPVLFLHSLFFLLEHGYFFHCLILDDGCCSVHEQTMTFLRAPSVQKRFQIYSFSGERLWLSGREQAFHEEILNPVLSAHILKILSSEKDFSLPKILESCCQSEQRALTKMDQWSDLVGVGFLCPVYWIPTSVARVKKAYHRIIE